jgi:hemolysin type calcium-binding protein
MRNRNHPANQHQQQRSTTMPNPTTTTTNRPRRRIGHMLLAAAVAACVLPAAAEAGVLEEAADGKLVYRAAAGESNNLSVTNQISGAVSIRDLTGLTERTPLCDNVSSIRVNCVPDTPLSEIRLGDRNDNFAIGVVDFMVVDGGPGDDGYTAGTSPSGSLVAFSGGEGSDSVSYSNADRGVRLSNDGASGDGRPGLDEDNIGRDVERLTGSRFGDDITAAGDATFSFPLQSITGGQGDDTLRDGPGSVVTFFDMGSVADGADDIIGGSGESRLDYTSRTRPVNVTLNFGGADDGEAGEGDEITGGNESVGGGSGGDTLRAPAGSTAFHRLTGGGGDDTLEGADGPDTLNGNSGVDTIIANGGADLVEARDNVGDIIGCGAGTDTAELDPNTLDVSSSCENRRVGVLRLAPKRLRVEAGQTAQLKLSWRHPRSWQRLRRIELRVYDGDAAVGEVAIRPRGQQVSADGAVKLARRSRIARRGKAVSARLLLRLDRSLAGQGLRVAVEAVDVRGARQLEPRAGSIRVAS